MGTIGLAYALVLTGLGVITSGGGHFNLPIALAISPVPVGFFAWPFLFALYVDLRLKMIRLVYVTIVLVQYIGLVLYFLNSENTAPDIRNFHIGSQDPIFVVCVSLALALYIAAQLLLWSKLVREIAPTRTKVLPSQTSRFPD